MTSIELIEELTKLVKLQADVIFQQAELLAQHEAADIEEGGANDAMV